MIYLSIGSNLPSSFGNRFENINLAVTYLGKQNIKLLKRSSFYETFSYPDITKPKFINIVISVESLLPPKEMMTTLISVEERLERKRKKKNDPRTCDIDIIDYQGKIMKFKLDNFELTLPHRSMTDRNFVLYPLKEVSPNWKHPVTKKNIDLLIKNLKTTNNDITKLSEDDISKYAK